MKYSTERSLSNKGNMKKAYKIALFLVICINTILVIVNLVFLLTKLNNSENDEDISEYRPLMLTPYLKDGNYKNAQILSEVRSNKFLDVPSHSGYLTVNPETDSHMFFWYFPATRYQSTAPLLLWLQGGPGTSALYGLFTELGPFVAISNEELIARRYSWNRDFNLLFLDNPVGTGFSLTKDGYVQNETDVGRDLYTVMLQFFQLFPDLENRQFFICGESYAGKFVPALAYAIHENNPSAKQKINLQGISIGNGLADPVNQLNFADYLFQLGLVDQNQRILLQSVQTNITDLIKQQKYDEAFPIYSDLISETPEYSPHGSLVRNMTGFKDNYNYLIANNDDPILKHWESFISSTSIRKALHADLNKEFAVRALDVRKQLYGDYLKSVAPWISELLSHYRVLVYSGQMDITVAYPLTRNFLNQLNFSAAQEYATAPRHKWFVEDELAGYWKTAGNLTEVLIRNAGHMAPRDQPKWTYDMLNKFITYKH